MTADVIVIGAGAFGTSIAYHLARSGASVVLLEQHDVADGTTWHSAGMVGQLRASPEMAQLISYSARLYAGFESQTPGSLGWRPTGSLRVATTSARMDEMAAMAAVGTDVGIESSALTPHEIGEIAPDVRTDDLVGAVHVPGDGCLDPERLALHLAERATDSGAQLTTHATVTSLTSGTSYIEVHTDQGTLPAAHVVVAAGFRTGMLLDSVGVFVPIIATRHQILWSNSLSGGTGRLPNLREPDKALTMRPWGDAVAIGSYARRPAWDRPRDVAPSARVLFDPEPDNMREVWLAAVHRIPELARVGWTKVIRGPEGVTPDGEPVISPTEIPGLWVVAGGSGHGIAAAGGIGDAVARAITTDRVSTDLDRFALARFPSTYASDYDAMLTETESNEIGHYDLPVSGEARL
jgi:glycine/D-amino acid oxidase-like deaminating enzyme